MVMALKVKVGLCQGAPRVGGGWVVRDACVRISFVRDFVCYIHREEQAEWVISLSFFIHGLPFAARSKVEKSRELSKLSLCFFAILDPSFSSLSLCFSSCV